MRLKKLEIIGFKSFADKTVLEFSTGITGIVGPNGCGKSNIGDAFRWVLGEQSAKSLRGNKMQDVIFAGTSSRAPLNFAEVTITFDNSERLLPIDYAEVAVTRRLHRSGDSDYFINRQPVRLRDVQNLFLDSGIGKDAFAIFEQGKIDQVIQQTPLDRRYIFEEAAGISRFLQRKQEALRKLEQVDLNVARVKDIHQEVEKQITVLEQQATKARLYKEQKATLDLLEKLLLVSKWDQTQQRFIELNAKEEKQQQQLTKATHSLEHSQAKIIEAKNTLTQSEQALRHKKEALFQTRNTKELKRRDQNAQQERQQESLVKEQRWQQELNALLAKRKQHQSERHSLEQQLHTLKLLVDEQEQSLQIQRDRTVTLEEALASLRELQRNAHHDKLKLLQTENQIEGELKQNILRQETMRERRESLHVRKETLSKLIEDLTKRSTEKKQELDLASKTVDAQKSEMHSIEDRIHTVLKDIQNSKQAIDALHEEIADGKAQQKALLRLREDKEGFSAGSKLLLQAAANQKSPLHGLLRGIYELIIPNSGSEVALASALRPYMQTLVVETRAHFNTVLAYAHEHKLKDYSVVCLEALPTYKANAPIAKNLELLLNNVAPHPMAQHLLQQTYVVNNIDEAMALSKKHPGVVVWTKDGNLLDANGVLFCTIQTENNTFLREAELKSLTKQLQTLEGRRQKLDGSLGELQRHRESLQTTRADLDKCIRRDEMKLVEVNFGVQRLVNDLEKATAEEHQIANDMQTVITHLEAISAKLSDLTQRHIAAQAKAAETQQQYALLESEISKQSDTLKNEAHILRNAETSYRKASDEYKKLLHSIHILDTKDSESITQAKHLNTEIQHMQQLQVQAEQGKAALHLELQDIEKLLQQAETACAELELETNKRKGVIDTLDAELQRFRGQHTQFESELYRLNMQKTQMQTSLQTLENDLQERFSMTIEVARTIIPGEKKESITIDQIERQLRKLRQEIESAGDINMTSIEEFDKHKERFEFLSVQLNDLNASKQELIHVITQLDSESRKIFKETFAIIRSNFQKNFNILFNGGEADLQLTESGDILDAGIEIIAKPPGKQMRSIQLLSGGEKCLTATALLFAIFEVKPAPFCILDEIDAPLDDGNVERFSNMVKQFIDRCQFIIVTHNKRTMSIADVLCGVTMEEKGVSKLLSIELKQNAQRAFASAKL